MTEIQKQTIDAYIKAGSYRGAARLLGKAEATVRASLKSLEARGEVPWRSPAPAPAHLHVKSSTVQYNAAGEVIQEWRRQFPQAEMMQDIVDGL